MRLPRPLCAFSWALRAFAGVALAGSLQVSASLQLVQTDELHAWQRAEFRIEGAPAAGNNFDPEEIAIDAEFTAPSATKLIVPAFWTQDFRRELAQDSEKLTEVGSPGWRLRFTPAEPGTYQVILRCRRRGDAALESAVTQCTVTERPTARRTGWVRVGADASSFATTDGRPLRLIGSNVCWGDTHGTFNYDEWFAAMEKSGQNFARLWMAPWWAEIEQIQPALNHYGLRGAWQLDHVFAEAERRGIYLLLCFDFHGMFQTDNPAWGGSGNFWPRNPYNVANGGPCRSPNDFFTDPAARRFYEKRLRYLIARYGASPQLLAWQFFNEIDNVFEPRGLRGADVIAWHRDMARWMKTHDPFGHLVTTSLTGGSDRPEMWAVPEMDFAVFHSYDEVAPARRHAALTRDFLERYRKPVLIGEFGVNGLSWARATDPKLRGFRQALWGGALGGSAGSPLAWWWHEMHQDNVYPVFTAMHGVLQAAGWDEGSWRPAALDEPMGGNQGTAGGPPPAGAVFAGEVNLNRQGRISLPGHVILTGPLAADRAFERVSAYVRSGTAAPPQAQFEAEWGKDASLTVHFMGVRGAPEVVARVDQAEAARLRLTPPKTNLPYRQFVDQTLTIAVPAGRHTVSLGCEGGEGAAMDRCTVKGVMVTPDDGARFGPEAVALRQERKAIVYLVSPRVVYPAGANWEKPPALRGVTVGLRQWPDGAFQVAWYDPQSGSLICRERGLASDGRLTIHAPDFAEDLAAVVTPD